jgi:hypothetical protein
VISSRNTGETQTEHSPADQDMERKERKRLEPEKLVKWNKTERKRNEKQDKMLKN